MTPDLLDELRHVWGQLGNLIRRIEQEEAEVEEVIEELEGD